MSEEAGIQLVPVGSAGKSHVAADAARCLDSRLRGSDGFIEQAVTGYVFKPKGVGLRPNLFIHRTQIAFPFGDDGGGDAIAEHIGGGAAHIEEMIDAEDQQ